MSENLTVKNLLEDRSSAGLIVWKDNISIKTLNEAAKIIVEGSTGENEEGIIIADKNLLDQLTLVTFMDLMADNINRETNRETAYDVYFYADVLRFMNPLIKRYYDKFQEIIDIYVKEELSKNQTEYIIGRNVTRLALKAEDALQATIKVLDKVDPNILIKYGQPILDKLIDKLPDFNSQDTVHKLLETIKH